MITGLAIIVFGLSWLSFILNWIIMMISKRKLQKEIQSRFPEIRNELSIRTAQLDVQSLVNSNVSLVKLFLNFGSIKKSKEYVNQFVDIDAIENQNDSKLNRLLGLLIRSNSNMARLWVTGIVSIITALIFWPAK